MLCLHGFGEQADSFSFLEKALGDNYTIYAPDFPWHGQTVWRKTLTFPVSWMIAVMQQMIEGFHEKKIELLCYSMGGRVGLSLLERIPDKIVRAVFIAPDGLKVNGWYWLATQTRVGNGLFRFTMYNPKWFSGFVDFLHRHRRINMSVVKFIHQYIDDKKMRDDLYRIWTTMRKFRPNLKVVKANITAYRLPVHLIFGTYDRVILAENGYRFQRGVESFVHIHVLKTGHKLLHSRHLADIIACLDMGSTQVNS